jgi:glycerol-3-phosphate dehydrogenase
VASPPPNPAERERQWHRLGVDTFDVVIIGGGATGAGLALEATRRGLATALVESGDFSAGTSSKSTKLLHGGVRYLEAAVKRLDRSQYALVREALEERAKLLALAPHLSHPLALLTPIYRAFEGPYYRVGLRIYDWLAGKNGLVPSRWLDANEARSAFPGIRIAGLRGGVLYYDGQFDDSRLNVSLALAAAEGGACVLNYVRLESFEKDRDGRLVAGNLRDVETGATTTVRGRTFVNAAGPLADAVRRLADRDAAPVLRTSIGTHLVLPASFGSPIHGLLLPRTSDGRVLFALPWQGHTLVGTTDVPHAPVEDPRPEAGSVDYLLRELSSVLESDVPHAAVRAVWSGLRPLPRGTSSGGYRTARITRDHFVETLLPSGLLTVTGGKWTTYRRMAKDGVDRVVARLGRGRAEPLTDEVLPGAETSVQGLAEALEADAALDPRTALRLVETYGCRARNVATLAKEDGSKRLLSSLPYLEAEVRWAARREFARNAVDVLARRLRLAFVDAENALRALPRVNALLAEELRWTAERSERELGRSREALEAFHPSPSRPGPTASGNSLQLSPTPSTLPP